MSDDGAVLVAGYIQGAIKFASAAITGRIAQAFLTLNPYTLPLFGQNVDVYGYPTTLGQLSESDANAGTFLGTLVLPPNLGFGQDAFFDVTAFVTTINAPFLAFNLRSAGGTDDFSSLELNYGSSVPAPDNFCCTRAATRCPVDSCTPRLLWHLTASTNWHIHTRIEERSKFRRACTASVGRASVLDLCDVLWVDSGRLRPIADIASALKRTISPTSELSRARRASALERQVIRPERHGGER